ncbi:catalase family protein [Paraliomyxa miuraensis]|uniref:hypothetical protein n=1 Tax=Paraliomyxa miuraensis TaxID=376150 RepID=UPI00225A488E|nr:hypothetical protein [Paraliomyxa miuraensis]MCX4242175.1 hypothetical protein [Paraliomyxa miuraensis]
MATTGTGWREEIGPGEAERFEALAARLVPESSREGRALHRYGQIGLAGRFEVLDGLPAAVAQGLCARPGRYECYVRFSSGAGAVQPDRIPDQRGLAIKVVGVEGTKVIPGLEAAKTQDFLAILPSTFPFVDPEVFVGLVVAARERGVRGLAGFLIGRLGFFGGLGMLAKLARSMDKGKQSLAERTYFVPVPIRWGEAAAKLRLRPVERPPTPAALPRGEHHLADELRARVAGAPIRFAVDVQLYVDAERTPIEDPTVQWTEAVSPFVEVARLEIPAQDPASAAGERLTEVIEGLSFDPWHALVEHRPLGSIMRARGVAYRVSTMARGASSELEVVPPSELGSG